MGFLRLLLATLVLTSHAGVAPIFTGVLAVECFYAISGFYIQLVISEQYRGQPRWVLRFYESRALRIYVPYWIILGMIAILSLLLRAPMTPLPLITLFHQAPLSGDAWIALLSNLFIVGTEEFKLIRILDSCGSFFWSQQIIQPAWSVGVELLFYAIAPFMLRLSTRSLVLIVAATACAKYALLSGLAELIFFRTTPCADGLLNGIVPLEMGVFCAGALCYRFYRHYHTVLKERYWLWITLITIMTAEALWGMSVNDAITPMVTFHCYALGITLTLPFLFAASRTLRYDRLVGEISYPFYLAHIFIINHLPLPMDGWKQYPSCALKWLVTVAVSYVIVRCVEKPLSRFRHRHFRTNHRPTEV